jgi:hypothetical protein
MPTANKPKIGGENKCNKQVLLKFRVHFRQLHKLSER